MAGRRAARRTGHRHIDPHLEGDNHDTRHGRGLADVQVENGPFDMMNPPGFLHDEGLANGAAVMA